MESKLGKTSWIEILQEALESILCLPLSSQNAWEQKYKGAILDKSPTPLNNNNTVLQNTALKQH